MFVLSGTTPPKSAGEFAQRLQQGLQQFLSWGPKSRVTATGNAPAFSRVAIDLSGSTIPLERPACLPNTKGRKVGTLTIDSLSITARPIHCGGSRASVEFQGQQISGELRNIGHGLSAFLPDEAEGRIGAEMDVNDIVNLAANMLQPLLAKHDTTCRDWALQFTKTGPRSLQMRATVTATKKLLVFSRTEPFELTGRMDVDDELNATFADLQIRGTGMIGELAAQKIQPKLNDFNGYVVPLSALPVRGLKFRDVAADVARNRLALSGSFAI
ncbi:MAG: hypothetical protein U0935_13515 [Pirellulales bacterium]